MNNDRIMSGLGLCAKAGKLVYGVPLVCEALRRPFAVKLVIESGDTSANTHKKLTDKCRYYETEIIKLAASGEELASAVGKGGSLGAVAITDGGLSEMMKRLLGDSAGGDR